MRSPEFDIGIGKVVVATIWLAFYAIVAVGGSLDISRMRQDIVSMDVSQNHQNVKNLPARKFND